MCVKGQFEIQNLGLVVLAVPAVILVIPGTQDSPGSKNVLGIFVHHSRFRQLRFLVAPKNFAPGFPDLQVVVAISAKVSCL